MPAIPAVITELYDAFEARDSERMRACWAEDAIYESPSDGFRREGVDAIMVDWLTVVSGLITVDRLFFDRLELLTQLGLVPRPEGV